MDLESVSYHGERHRFFFGIDPKQPEWPSQQRAIAERIKGNYRVICGHCGVGLMGELGYEGPVTEIIWRHDGNTWFGTFTFSDCASGNQETK